MTGKMAALARAIAQGIPLKDAAAEAGYNLAYARKKTREPAFRALVERFRKQQDRETDPRDAVSRLWAIIDDPASTNQERTGAIRALIAYERANGAEKEIEPPTIIDDIPEVCRNCPYSENFLTEVEADGLRTGDDDREGCETDPEGVADPAGPKGPADGGDQRTA